ncbi:MAG: hypothetical protein CME59_13300 [Halioglobus sp.]|nr:hypothetical protein [Halioglobus sp.]|tara:strand:+ start:2055 stop:2597 length:543 start_codon:yes stop_codon:yes gene_type:complete
MTQHEYVFVAISIILGLAITRLLHNVAMLIRAHREVSFHWSTALWGVCVMSYSLQLWWVGWGLNELTLWSFGDYVVLTAGSIFVYGAAEMALPVPESDRTLDFLRHSRGLGRLSALSMTLYFAVGPYVNIALFGNEFLPSLLLPAFGMVLTGLIIGIPRLFPLLSVLFAVYTLAIVAITT